MSAQVTVDLLETYSAFIVPKMAPGGMLDMFQKWYAPNRCLRHTRDREAGKVSTGVQSTWLSGIVPCHPVKRSGLPVGRVWQFA